jgi:L-ribulose-5-phosphate 3-epimerase
VLTGINQWIFPADMPVRNALDLARETGFESFEICVGEEGPLQLDVPDKELASIRRYARDAGLKLHSVGSGLGWQYPLTSPDASVRRKGKEYIIRTLEIARELGAESVLVVPGVVTPDIPYDAALENALESVRDLAPKAEETGVRIGLENVWNRFLLSPVEMRDFIDQCESDYVGAYFDIGNIMPYGFPEQWIRILGRRIGSVHARDFRVPAGNADGFVMLLEGDVDWPAVVQALAETGYDGPLTAEYGAYRHSLETALRHCRISLEAILGR